MMYFKAFLLLLLIAVLQVGCQPEFNVPIRSRLLLTIIGINCDGVTIYTNGTIVLHNCDAVIIAQSVQAIYLRNQVENLVAEQYAEDK